MHFIPAVDVAPKPPNPDVDAGADVPNPNAGLAGWLPKRPMEVAGWAVAAPKPPKPVLVGAAPNAVLVGWAAPNVGATAPKGLAGCPNMPPAWVVVDPKPNAGAAVVAAGAPKAVGFAPKSPPA